MVADHAGRTHFALCRCFSGPFKIVILHNPIIKIFGSFNYTGAANKSNDENILIVGDLEEKDAAAISAQKRIGKGCRKEIERIATRFGSPV